MKVFIQCCNQLIWPAALAISLVGCGPSFEGAYSDPAKAEIVDDKWNETDARTTAENMVKSVLSKPWLQEFRTRKVKSLS